MQIHAEYSLYGHFFYLKQLFGGVEKLRFFLDQDSGMRAACLAAFQPEIAVRRADAFYVRISKEMTIAEKQVAIAPGRAAFRAARNANPELTDSVLITLITKERIANMVAIGKWQDKWMTHPFPNMSEPEKAVCYLTDYRCDEPDDWPGFTIKPRCTRLITSSCRCAGGCRYWSDQSRQPIMPSVPGMGTVPITRKRS